MTFPLSVYSIDREIFAGQASAVTVPGAEGQLQILANHTPLVSLLKEGDIAIEGENSKKETLPIRGGVLEVNSKEVVVLVNF